MLMAGTAEAARAAEVPEAARAAEARAAARRAAEAVEALQFAVWGKALEHGATRRPTGAAL